MTTTMRQNRTILLPTPPPQKMSLKCGMMKRRPVCGKMEEKNMKYKTGSVCMCVLCVCVCVCMDVKIVFCYFENAVVSCHGECRDQQ